MEWVPGFIKPTKDEYFMGYVLAICEDGFPRLVGHDDETGEWKDEECTVWNVETWCKIIPPGGFNGA